MIQAVSTALSGLTSARQQLNVSASNIANQRTTGPVGGPTSTAGYQPVEAVAVSQSGGGVRTSTRPVTPASVPVFEPDSPFANEDGIVGAPNISVAEQLINAQQAVRAFEANAAVIKAADEAFGSLLDATA